MGDQREDRYRSILDRYIKLLEELREVSDWPDGPPPLPFLPIAVVNKECPLQTSPDLTRLLVGPDSRGEGLRELRDFTLGASRLTILDPYFFAGDAARAPAIAEDFARVARVAEGRLKAVHVIRDERLDTKAVLTSITRTLRPSGVRFTQASSQEVHDRVWVADSQRAVVIGTSFNGLGTRAAFILPLPITDLNAILEFLYGRGLVRRPARKSKS